VCTLLDGDGENVAGVFEHLVAVAQSIGYTVENAEFADSRNGDCAFDLHRIRVASDRSPVQRIKSLAHELGHAMLHEQCDDRRLAELEAESVAFVVCASLGINSDEYSFGYVATWAGGGDEAIAKINAVCFTDSAHRSIDSLVVRDRAAGGGGVKPNDRWALQPAFARWLERSARDSVSVQNKHNGFARRPSSECSAIWAFFPSTTNAC